MNIDKSGIIKVSVIVPVFNAADYLEQCIESIINQSLYEIEIIIINDGSTDRSAQIIANIAAKDKRIVCVDGVNQGVSAARNKGLEIAQGRFISFVDADDFMEQSMLENLFREAAAMNAELTVCNVNLQERLEKPIARLKLKNECQYIAENRPQVISDFMDFKYDYANWNKLYSRQIIHIHKIKFDEKMKVWEDLLFNLIFLSYTERLCIINKCLYNYRIHDHSVMSTYKDIVTAYNLLFKKYRFFSKKENDEKNLFDVFRVKMARGCFYNLIPKIVTDAKAKASTAIAFIRLLSKELMRFEPEIFFFSRTELKGLQGIKKRLLMNGRFVLFAQIIAIKYYFIKWK